MGEALISLSKAIAQNPVLQAISIVVAIGSFLVFLWKNVPPAFIFVRNLISSGVKSAVNNLASSAARRARTDYGDIRLIFTSSIVLITRILLTLFNAIFAIYLAFLMSYIAMKYSNAFNFLGHLDLFDWRLYFLIVVVFVIIFVFCWFIATPVVHFATYIHGVRQLLRRESEDKSKEVTGIGSGD